MPIMSSPGSIRPQRRKQRADVACDFCRYRKVQTSFLVNALWKFNKSGWAAIMQSLIVETARRIEDRVGIQRERQKKGI